MNSLGGTATSAILGGASPANLFRDFTGALRSSTWYPSALADMLHGVDNQPGADDIVATFNSDVDTGNLLTGSRWYYGLDGYAGNDVDFISVVLHELIHGLGFITVVDPTTGAKGADSTGAYDDDFMVYLEDYGKTPADFPSMTDAQRQAASIDTGNLVWSGSIVNTAAGSLLTKGLLNNQLVEMYAPNPVEVGSTLSHFDTSLAPDQLMEPNYTGPNHDPGLALPALGEIGWGSVNTGTGTADLGVNLSASATGVPTALKNGTQVTYTVGYSNPGPAIANQTILTFLLPAGAGFISASPSQAGCSTEQQVVTCLLGDLNPDPNTTYTVQVTAALNYSGSNQASALITSASADSDATNNAAGAVVQVASPLVQIISGTGGGGGCALGTSRSIDPTLPIWLLMSLWYVLRRRRQ